MVSAKPLPGGYVLLSVWIHKDILRSFCVYLGCEWEDDIRANTQAVIRTWVIPKT